MNDNPILVIGARGKTGRRVAERLTAAGRPFRAASRTTGFDLTDPATWDAALDGVRDVYLVPFSEYTDAATLRDFAATAVSAGARRIVLLSARGHDGVHPLQEAGETAVRESGAAYTILRPAWFHQNFSEDYLLPSVLDGRIALPAGTGREAFVDADDIAAMAVAALTEDGHEGAAYELTGPEALGFADVAATLAKATGRDIRYDAITPDDYVAALVAEDVPEHVAVMLTDLFQEIADGKGDRVDDAIPRVLGRPARSFAAYAEEAAGTGVWT
ncbi:NAD(P)H-binding protein [Actinomadura flavalba]|uniref:NmrA family NAD(P)-binding protein n=1 Tax=Actinomadura flavalba TaxID=1120938 RepID=UPI00039EE927|nr:NAD(P)H-binding protein [Actinomadura flavalba]